MDLVLPLPAFPRSAKPVWKGFSLCGTNMETTQSQGRLLSGKLIYLPITCSISLVFKSTLYRVDTFNVQIGAVPVSLRLLEFLGMLYEILVN